MMIAISHQFACNSRRIAVALLVLAALMIQHETNAAQPSLRIFPEADLRFGTFAVMDRGHRIVSPSGAVQSVGIFSTGNSGTGPARFRVQYDRGNNGRKRLDVRVELRFSATPVVTQDGVVALLSQYQTDLPGYAMVAANQAVTVNMPNCVQRLCEASFNLGGRLNVERSYGGASVTLPIPVEAVLISVD